MKYALIGLVGCLVGATAARADSRWNEVVDSCYEFPEVSEQNIVNARGDQAVLRSDEHFHLDYAYRTRETVRLAGESSDKVTFEEYEKVKNGMERFRGDTVQSVKNQALVYVRSREPHKCTKIKRTEK